MPLTFKIYRIGLVGKRVVTSAHVNVGAENVVADIVEPVALDLTPTEATVDITAETVKSSIPLSLTPSEAAVASVAEDVAIEATGQQWIFFTDGVNDTLNALDLTAWESNPSTTPTTIATFSSGAFPRGCAVDANGNIYVCLRSSNKVVKLTYDGSGDRTDSANYSQSDFVASVTTPFDCEVKNVGGTDYLYVTHSTVNTTRYPLAGGAGVGAGFSGNVAIRGICSDDDYFFTSNSASVGQTSVCRYAHDGTGDTNLMTGPASGNGVATDGVNYAYCSASGAVHRELRDNSGSTEVWLNSGDGLVSVGGMEVFNGHLYLCDTRTDGTGRIARYDLSTKSRDDLVDMDNVFGLAILSL